MNEEARRTLTDGRQIYPEHVNKIADGPRKGQQQDYVVLADDRFGDIALIVLVFGIVIGAGVYFGAFG